MKKVLAIFLFLICSCDFSPKLQQEILKAQELISRGEYKKATGLYEKILTMNMNSGLRIKIFYQLADLYSIFLDDVEKGRKYYNKVLESTKNTSEQIKALERIGEINFTYLKKYKEAKATYDRLLEIEATQKDHDFFDLRIALSLLNLNEYEKAQNDFKKISANLEHKFNVISYYYLGLIHFRKSEWEEAISVWKKYLEVEKRKDKIIEVRFLMANTYETMENLKEAYAIYYSLLGEYPNTAVIQNRLKAVYLRKVSRKR